MAFRVMALKCKDDKTRRFVVTPVACPMDLLEQWSWSHILPNSWRCDINTLTLKEDFNKPDAERLPRTEAKMREVCNHLS